MLSITEATAATIDGPISPESYKRAVYRQPPSHFKVVMLEPTKQGGSYAFGMTIVPRMQAGDRSSISSRGSDTTEYDIWRRWEDCLWFQDSLELEYKRQAKSKKSRLASGKGVRKNEVYKRGDAASSWDSLPPGPDPSSITTNLHDYVPKLTKKGTLFRVSQAMIAQRKAELSAFIAALFDEEVPTLIKELRSDRIVTDFFGYWRRDHDLDVKGGVKSPSRERYSTTSSVLSSYFSDINPSSASSHRSQSPTASLRGPSSASSTTVRASTADSVSVSSPPRRRRTISSGSSDSSSTTSGRSSTSSTSTVPTVFEDVPVVFDRKSLACDHQIPSEALQEGEEGGSRSPGSPLMRRPKVAPEERRSRANRNTQIFGQSDRSTIRESWATTASAATYLEDLGLDFSPGAEHPNYRDSVSSIATFMTNSSVDAVLPREREFIAEIVRGTSDRNSLASTIRRLSGLSEDDGDIYDAFPRPGLPLPTPRNRLGGADSEQTPPASAHAVPDLECYSSSESSSPPATPVVTASFPRSPTLPKHLGATSPKPRSSTFSEPVSPVSSTFSEARSSISTGSMVTPVSPGGKSGAITVKVAHNSSIILLRVSRDLAFAEVRNRIQEKFKSQEDVHLTDSFTLAIVLPPSVRPSTHQRTDSEESNVTMMSIHAFQMNLLASQNDWDKALTTMEGPKMTLRVLDTLS